jgi:hypothetical protein
MRKKLRDLTDQKSASTGWSAERQIAQKIIDLNFRINRITAIENNMLNFDMSDNEPDFEEDEGIVRTQSSEILGATKPASQSNSSNTRKNSSASRHSALFRAAAAREWTSPKPKYLHHLTMNRLRLANPLLPT